ncbi:hypothetical protein C8P63_11089 [Melghirimyces profundicolus]|uniref:Uncharacterized protein n=1 Tax=Melghirimyces profundicolus TaxID=1242148 RepID=A0A2T6BV51_9BACL|nr:hypothetical protein [Melghirimyces profundicolus]PTX59944.1 hypothetical protein C8P63_11089 [Melghirimyces profundicolus]
MSQNDEWKPTPGSQPAPGAQGPPTYSYAPPLYDFQGAFSDPYAGFDHNPALVSDMEDGYGYGHDDGYDYGGYGEDAQTNIFFPFFGFPFFPFFPFGSPFFGPFRPFW